MGKIQNFQQIANTFEKIQEKICNSLTSITGENYQEDCWDYKIGKGGGRTRAFTCNIIEKGGVNFSNIEGQLSEDAAHKLNLPISKNGIFQACGVSIILHPYNPFVPAIHLNIRCFQSEEKRWFGGGVDLNPYYPFLEDIIFFHTHLKKNCDKFNKNYYSQFKKNCDQYFYNTHRKETRGVGGIFFDHLNEEDFAFTQSLGDFLLTTYIAIMQKRMYSPFRHFQKEYQSYRRARYVEFNLLYDKGTAFGLQTGGRLESIFLSLPPVAKWTYKFPITAGSEEQNHQKFFQIQDWIELE